MTALELMQGDIEDLSREAKNMRALAQRKLKHWHLWRKNMLQLDDVVDTQHRHDATCMGAFVHWDGHRCTRVTCSLDGRKHYPPHTCRAQGCIPNMHLINESIRLYGCIRSGKHHFCAISRSHRCLSLIKDGKDKQKDRVGDGRYNGCKHSMCVAADPLRNERCVDTVMSRDSEHVCVFSSMIVSAHITRSHYEKPASNKNRFCTTQSDQDETSSHADESTGDPGPSVELWPTTSTGGAKTKKTSKPSTSSGNKNARGTAGKRKHAEAASSTSASTGKRRCTGRGKRNAGLAAPPMDCDESGSSVSSGCSLDGHADGPTKEDTNRRVQRRIEALRMREDDAHRIIFDLLFEEASRKRVNTIRHNQSMGQFVSRTAMYLGQTEGLGRVHTVMEIYQGERVEIIPSAPANVHEKMGKHYAKLCVRMWKLLGLKRLTCSYQQYVLALLYTLRHGLKKKGQIVAEPDEFLYKYLPHQNDLCHFRCTVGKNSRNKRSNPRSSSSTTFYKKKDITIGDTRLRSAIHNSSYDLLKRGYDGSDWDPQQFARESANRSIARKLERYRNA